VVLGGLVIILIIIWGFLFVYFTCKRNSRRYTKTGFIPPTQQHFDAFNLPHENTVRCGYTAHLRNAHKLIQNVLTLLQDLLYAFIPVMLLCDTHKFIFVFLFIIHDVVFLFIAT